MAKSLAAAAHRRRVQSGNLPPSNALYRVWPPPSSHFLLRHLVPNLGLENTAVTAHTSVGSQYEAPFNLLALQYQGNTAREGCAWSRDNGLLALIPNSRPSFIVITTSRPTAQHVCDSQTPVRLCFNLVVASEDIDSFILYTTAPTFLENDIYIYTHSVVGCSNKHL